MQNNYETPELVELGVLSMDTLSSSASAGVGKGDDNGEEINPGGN